MLEHFIAANRDGIILRCRAKVALRHLAAPPEAEILHGVPLFLNQLVDALRPGAGSNPEIGRSALHHGHELLQRGFTVSQVVHDYGDVCQSITQLAVEKDAPISTADFRTLNQCLDEAIAGAVTEYGRERTQSSHDDATTEGTEHLGFFAHELRNLVNTAILSYRVLKTGNVGLRRRSRRGARPRARRPAYLHQPFTRGSPTAARGPASRGDLAGDIHRRTDRRGGTGRPCTGSTAGGRAGRGGRRGRSGSSGARGRREQSPSECVQVHPAADCRTTGVGSSEERVLIEIEDECGELPQGNTDELFRPFEQRGTDRTGLGLGLAFSAEELAQVGTEDDGGGINTDTIMLVHIPQGGGKATAVSLPRDTWIGSKVMSQVVGPYADGTEGPYNAEQDQLLLLDGQGLHRAAPGQPGRHRQGADRAGVERGRPDHADPGGPGVLRDEDRPLRRGQPARLLPAVQRHRRRAGLPERGRQRPVVGRELPGRPAGGAGHRRAGLRPAAARPAGRRPGPGAPAAGLPAPAPPTRSCPSAR